MYRKVLAGLLGIMMCASLASCGDGDSLSRISSGSSAAELSGTESVESGSAQPESKTESDTSSDDADSTDTQPETESKPEDSTPELKPVSEAAADSEEPESTPEESTPEESVQEPEDESSQAQDEPVEPDEPEESESDSPADGGTAKGSAVSVKVGDGWLDLTENKNAYLDKFIATLTNETLVESLKASDKSAIEALYGYWAEGFDDVELFFHITAPVHYSEFEGLTFDQYKERFKSMWSFASDNAGDVGYTLSINDSLEFGGVKFIEAEMDFDSDPAGCSVEKVYQAFSGGNTYSISFFAVTKDAQQIMDGEIESILSTFSFNS